MALVSRCPRCQQPVTIPTGVDAVTRVCCPTCKAEYALYEAMGGASTVPDWLTGPPLLVLALPAEPVQPAEAALSAPPEVSIGESASVVATTPESPVDAAPESGAVPSLPPPIADSNEPPTCTLLDAPVEPVEASSMPEVSAATTETPAIEMPGVEMPAVETLAIEKAAPAESGVSPIALAVASAESADTTEHVADMMPFLPPDEPFGEETEDSDFEEDDAVDPALFGGTSRMSPAVAPESQPVSVAEADSSSSGTTESLAPASLASRERISARIKGRPSNALRNTVGLVLFSGLGLLIPYYGLSLISPSFNFLGIKWLPGVRTPTVQRSNVAVERPKTKATPAGPASDGRWPGFAESEPTPPKKGSK